MADHNPQTQQPDEPDPHPAASDTISLSGWQRVKWTIARTLCASITDHTRRRIEADAVRTYQSTLATKAENVVHQLVRDGRWLGAPPHGYTLDTASAADDTAVRSLAVDDERAATVPLIFAWHVFLGLGASAIATRLAAVPGAYPPPIDPATGRLRPWTAARVETILANPAYLGHTVRGRTRHGRHVHPHRWTRSTRPSHPALVTPDIFWTAYRRAHPEEYAETATGIAA